MSCKCADCGSEDSYNYLYRNLKGVSTFTGFIKSGDKIVWIGKDEKSHREIKTDADRAFFMSIMKQFDR